MSFQQSNDSSRPYSDRSNSNFGYDYRGMTNNDPWSQIGQRFFVEGDAPLLTMQYLSVESNKILDKAFIGNEITDEFRRVFNDSLKQIDYEAPPNVTIENKDKLALWIEAEWTSQASENMGVRGFTPWTFEELKDSEEIFDGFLGPARPSLPVLLITQTRSHVHEMTEELMVGILTILDNNPNFRFYLQDVVIALGIENAAPIKLEDIVSEYLSNREVTEEEYAIAKYESQIYRVVINGIEYSFATPQFLQGIITAARWIGINPYNVITQITMNGVPQTF